MEESCFIWSLGSGDTSIFRIIRLLIRRFVGRMPYVPTRMAGNLSRMIFVFGHGSGNSSGVSFERIQLIYM